MVMFHVITALALYGLLLTPTETAGKGSSDPFGKMNFNKFKFVLS